MKSISWYLGSIIISFAFLTATYGQNQSVSGRSYIDKLLSNDSVKKARIELNKQIEFYKRTDTYDSLIKYIYLIGHDKLSKNNPKIAIANAELFVAEIKSRNNAYLSKEALLGLANLYATQRQFQKNYNANKDALQYAKKITPISNNDLAQIEYNLGTAAIDLQNLNLGIGHLYNSKKIVEKNSNINPELFYLTYNSIGRVKSKLLEIDSSNYYYNKSLVGLDKMENIPVNIYYKAGIVRQNIALNLFNSGNTEEAIKIMKNAITDFQRFIDLEKTDIKRPRAIRFRLSSIDNLGGFYSGIGDNNNAIDVMTYSLNEKRKFLSDDDANVILSNLIIGHAHLVAKNFNEAGKYIDEGLKYIEQTPFYEDYALLIRGAVFDNAGDIENAKKIYEKCETLYRKKNKQLYSLDFLDALIELSLFYAKNGMPEKAIQLATESYYHTHNPDFKNTSTQFKHTENLALVYFKLKNYKEALKYSNEAITMVLEMQNKLDSVQNEMNKPRALFINAKSRYQLKKTYSKIFLDSLLNQIEIGIKILEKRKTIINTSEDASLIIADNNDLFDFEKQLFLELYNKTKDENYLNELISTHESSVYSRIRSRLNLKSDIAFARIPKKTTERENTLKQKLTKSLSNSESIDSFFAANSQWDLFIDSLKIKHPEYYKMRYETIKQSLGQFQNKIPKETTVIRFIYVNEILFALVLSKNENKLIRLTKYINDRTEIKNTILNLNYDKSDITTTSNALFNLYQKLWHPINSLITTENIIIIPDQELFNLSFETLTPKKIKSFTDLTTNSLLAKHNVSYNYSLFLVRNAKPENFASDYVAFVPEFNDKMKTEYKIAITDSLDIDKSYLTLLPQPFSVDIANQFSELFNGTAYLNEKATKQIFQNSAKEHKIIHIGTHAESNNLSPELSRLIFAKNISDENNSLYTYEIYNQNLSSNLAILTACETGKPTFQSGEGMISLAHAFNYAGSESILTSLWEIDEQSSTVIIEYFYTYIRKGWTKDKALKQAKLDYINNSNGRTINPQYWAGLILIGDTAAINLESTTNWKYWLLAIISIIIVGLLLRKKS